jgi:thioesterase domain-containing protein/acyl carrier protein
VIFGGEALEVLSLQPWFDRHGDQNPQLVNMYGITETTVHVTYRPISTNDLRGGSVIGIPIPDLQIYVLDAHQEPVPLGAVGEMYVGGEGLARGYLNRPELTAQRFITDHLSGRPGARLYRTGDLARLLPGRDIEYLGRIDHQVKIRGFRIELGEIESSLLKHPDVREAVVIAREDVQGDKFLVAYVVCGIDHPTSEGLRNFLKQSLPEYMVPTSIVFMERFPLTENGKLDRRALPEATQEEERPNTERPFVPPVSETEKQLAEIWKDILRLPEIGLDDNFFDIGGTSLHGLRLFTRIRQEFRVALPLGTLFRAPTLQNLAALIESNSNASRGKSSPITCIQPAGDELPFFGIHGGDGGALFYKGLLPRLGTERPVFTIESPALLDESIPIESLPISQVAAEYLTLIRSVQRRGPYLLGGYSYGGIVAYEMAHQLLQLGEDVALLVLFDTENPNVPAREYSLGERIAVNWRSSQSGNVAGKLLQLGGRFSSGLIQRLRTESETASARKLLKQGVRADDERLRYVQIREANLEALEAYRATELDATMLLFRSDEISDKFDLSEDYDWTPMVRRLLIERVPGKHLDIFDEPNVSIMADKLRRRLEELVSPPLLA